MDEEHWETTKQSVISYSCICVCNKPDKDAYEANEPEWLLIMFLRCAVMNSSDTKVVCNIFLVW